MSDLRVFNADDFMSVHPSLREPLVHWITAHNLGTSPQRTLVGLAFSGTHVFQARCLVWPNEIDELTGVWKTYDQFIEEKYPFPIEEW